MTSSNENDSSPVVHSSQSEAAPSPAEGASAEAHEGGERRPRRPGKHPFNRSVPFIKISPAEKVAIPEGLVKAVVSLLN